MVLTVLPKLFLLVFLFFYLLPLSACTSPSPIFSDTSYLSLSLPVLLSPSPPSMSAFFPPSLAPVSL